MNLAEPWLKKNGFGTDEPDRIENVAKLMSREPAALRYRMAQRIKKRHGEQVARRIWIRSNELIRERGQ